MPMRLFRQSWGWTEPRTQLAGHLGRGDRRPKALNLAMNRAGAKLKENLSVTIRHTMVQK